MSKDEDLTEKQIAALRRLAEEACASIPWSTWKALTDRGLIVRGEIGGWNLTEAGRSALALHPVVSDPLAVAHAEIDRLRAGLAAIRAGVVERATPDADDASDTLAAIDAVLAGDSLPEGEG